MKSKSVHWADIYADKIIREKGEKAKYVCASGITPSGTVHIGNFREIISVDLVVKALREKNKEVVFLYSWDEYDVFRKVPENMPDKKYLETFLRKPITHVPDPYGKESSYARANEKVLEELLPIVGVVPQYIYQAQKYKASEYSEGIITALKNKEVIRNILNEHRTKPLADDWWPVTIFCNNCLKDTTKINNWDDNWKLTYSCSSCDNNEEIDIRETGAVKLLWRIDWPMRWENQKVDFEPAGKDHHSEGGSFDTARKIANKVYDYTEPVTFQYDFIRIKGRGGKISSSSGEVISLKDVLDIYQPEIVRYLFTGTRPNAEFAISFDLDVLKIYEDYDKCERIYYGNQTVNEKKREKEKRIYELSQVKGIPLEMPFQIPFRHLCNLLQINSGDISSVIGSIKGITEEQRERVECRARCARNWIQEFAPEDFRFSLQEDDSVVEIDEKERGALNLLLEMLKIEFDNLNEKQLAESLYGIAEKCDLEAKLLFNLIYRVLIGKEKGPRLASFILTVGKEKIVKVLKKYE